VPQLMASGHVVRAGMGVQLAPDQTLERLGLEGALVLGVLDGSPAEKAGLRPTQRDALGRVLLGDLIVAVDGKAVKSADDLTALLEDKGVGTLVRLRLRRGQAEIDVPVTLAALE